MYLGVVFAETEAAQGLHETRTGAGPVCPFPATPGKPVILHNFSVALEITWLDCNGCDTTPRAKATVSTQTFAYVNLGSAAQRNPKHVTYVIAYSSSVQETKPIRIPVCLYNPKQT